jgi:hypothetical protein
MQLSSHRYGQLRVKSSLLPHYQKSENTKITLVAYGIGSACGTLWCKAAQLFIWECMPSTAPHQGERLVA